MMGAPRPSPMARPAAMPFKNLISQCGLFGFVSFAAIALVGAAVIFYFLDKHYHKKNLSKKIGYALIVQV